MPRAVRFSQLGGPEVLHIEDVTVPEPKAGEVVMQVKAVGLNRAESMYFHGQYLEQPNLPSGLGYEAVGTVEAVGPDVDKALIGKQFGTIPGFSMNQYPSLGEKALVPARALAELPPELSVEEGAAVWMQYGTAYGALVELSKVSQGDYVIVTAASSSVGLAAIQIVKAQGSIAIATTRSSAKRDQLLQLGADHVIATAEEDLPKRVAEITGGRGARVVFDPVGGDYVNVLGQATANGGAIFVYGMLSGKPTPLPLTTFGREVSVTYYGLHQMQSPERTERMKRYIFEGLKQGKLKPKVDRVFAFDQVVNAYRYLEGNTQVGKIVIKL